MTIFKSKNWEIYDNIGKKKLVLSNIRIDFFNILPQSSQNELFYQ